MDNRFVNLQAVNHMLDFDAQMAAALVARLEAVDQNIKLMQELRKETEEVLKALFPDNFQEVRNQ